MSGLCVVVRFDGTPIPPDDLTPMTHTTPYRGHTTTHTHPHAHLAHQTHHPERPTQPHTHHHLTITATARIDNRDELLPHLQPHLTTPHPTDAELILAAHHHWGPDTPHHLIGDYAYVIHDTHTHTLHAARDPMGMRPLYYHHTPQRTTLASEIQQLLARPDVPTELFEPQVAAYLAGNVGPSDWTFYRGVAALPPGHALEIDANGARSRRFWQPDVDQRLRLRGEDAYADRLRELLLQSVRDRLQDPGTHGLLLSGGVDSGGIASCAGWWLQRGVGGEPLRTYSWAFEELTDGDERGVSRLITEAYGLPAVPVPADDAWPLAGYPDHGPDRDDPFVHPYQPLMDRAFGLAADDGVRTLMSGDRGDPLLGDDIYDHVGLWQAGRWWPAVRDLAVVARLEGTSWPAAARRHLLRPWLESIGRRTPATADPRKFVPRYLEPAWAERTGVRDLIAERLAALRTGGSASVARAIRLSTFTALLDPAPQERQRARFGLGFSDPWADRRLVEFVLATPPWRVQRASEPKRLARRALRGVVPDAALAAMGKGVAQGLFERGLYDRSRGTVRALSTGMRLAELGIVDESILRPEIEAFASGAGRHRMWWVLTLEMWLRAHHG